MPVTASFEDLRAKSRRVVLGGRDYFVLEGDLLMDETQLRRYADQLDEGPREPAAVVDVGGRTQLLVNRELRAALLNTHVFPSCSDDSPGAV